jgi:hypothetical protein
VLEPHMIAMLISMVVSLDALSCTALLTERTAAHPSSVTLDRLGRFLYIAVPLP